MATEEEKHAILVQMDEARDAASMALNSMFSHSKEMSKPLSATDLITWWQTWSPKAGYKRLGRLLQAIRIS